VFNRRSFLGGLLSFLGIESFATLLRAGYKDKDASDKKTYKYSKFIHKCDEATMDEFRDFVVIDEQGNTHNVPIIWATDERAEAVMQSVKPSAKARYVLGECELGELVVDKIRLPLMNIHNYNLHVQDGQIMIWYALTLRSLFREDMNQMLEQLIIKFNPLMKNKAGTYTMTMNATNDDKEGTKEVRVNKYTAWIGMMPAGKP
jgi:hypothetical protein